MDDFKFDFSFCEATQTHKLVLRIYVEGYCFQTNCSFTGYGSTELEAYGNLCKATESLYGMKVKVNDYVMKCCPALWEQLQQRWYKDMQQVATLFTVTKGDAGIVLTPKGGGYEEF